MAQQEVDRGEQQAIERDGEGKRLNGSQSRMLRAYDPVNLQGDDRHKRQ